jgi:nickel/cobalt exporter
VTPGDDETKRADTGHGIVRVEIFEDGVLPRFRLFQEGHHSEPFDPS